MLLRPPASSELYHRHAADLPIIDYHCHLPLKEIADDIRWDNIAALWLGGLRAACELNDAIDPGGCFRGERGVKEIAFAMDAALNRAGDERFFGLREFGVAEGSDDALAR